MHRIVSTLLTQISIAPLGNWIFICAVGVIRIPRQIRQINHVQVRIPSPMVSLGSDICVGLAIVTVTVSGDVSPDSAAAHFDNLNSERVGWIGDVNYVETISMTLEGVFSVACGIWELSKRRGFVSLYINCK